MDRSMRQCGGIFLTTVAIAVALRCAWEVWPGTLLGLFAPQNTSVWELSKMGCGPALPLRCSIMPLRDKSSLCAYLMVPAALPVALLFCVLVFAHGLRHLQRSCGCGSLDMPAGGGRGNGPFRPSDGLCRTGAAYGGYAAADLGVFLHFVFPAWGGSADFHRNDAVSAGGIGCMVK